MRASPPNGSVTSYAVGANAYIGPVLSETVMENRRLDGKPPLHLGLRTG